MDVDDRLWHDIRNLKASACLVPFSLEVPRHWLALRITVEGNYVGDCVARAPKNVGFAFLAAVEEDAFLDGASTLVTISRTP